MNNLDIVKLIGVQVKKNNGCDTTLWLLLTDMIFFPMDNLAMHKQTHILHVYIDSHAENKNGYVLNQMRQ